MVTMLVGGDSQGQRHARTYVRTNGEGALADRLSRSRIAYVRKYVRACARVRVSWLRNRLRTSLNGAKRDLDQPIHDSRRALLQSCKFDGTYCKAA